ncbi:MAG TPA: tyrosine-type recombinase/integrase [Capillimicrobium sp.]|nr:tyrosine-type recombinase/integrase [Capillimicrobium sp.]
MQAQRKPRRAYGSGSLTERNGSWYGAWRLNGKQVSRKVGPVRTRGNADGMTRAQAEARLRELMAHVKPEDVKSAPGQRRPGDLTVAELAERYIAHAREHRGLKEATTLTDYQSVVRNHLDPFFGELPIRRIDAPAIERLARALRTKDAGGRRGGKGKRLSPKSVANYLGTLSTLLNFAVRKGWIPSSPMAAVDLPAHKIIETGDAPIAELHFLEPHEVRRLVDAAVDGSYRLLDRALYTMAAYTGLRQGELRGLRWRNVDFDGPTVHVLEGVTRGSRRSSPKGKRRRSVPLAPTAAQALLDLRAASPWTRPEDPVFATPSTGQPMHRTGLMDRYRKALAVADLDPGFSFHDLRHTFGTTMARQGVPVGTIQAWMGHADLATTQLYMHYAPRARDAAMIDAAFGGAPNNPPNNLSVVGGTEKTSRLRKSA